MPISLREIERRAVAVAAEAFRLAIAKQLAEREDEGEWDSFIDALAILLASRWTRGIASIIRAGSLAISGPRAAPIAGTAAEVGDALRRWTPLRPSGLPNASAEIERWRARARTVAQDERDGALRSLADGSEAMRIAVERPFVATDTTLRQRIALRNIIADWLSERKTQRTRDGELREAGIGEIITKAHVEAAVDLTDARLETIVRTNALTAQADGQREAMRDPVVRRFVPLMRWSATLDSRTRVTHRAMHGYVGTVEDFEALGPPAGFNCRCALIGINLADALDAGLVDADGVPDRAAIAKHNGRRQALIDSGQFPDPGFRPGA